MPRPPHISGDIYRWGPHYENLTAWWWRRRPLLLVTDGDGLQLSLGWLGRFAVAVWAAARSPRFGQWTMFYAAEPT